MPEILNLHRDTLVEFEINLGRSLCGAHLTRESETLFIDHAQKVRNLVGASIADMVATAFRGGFTNTNVSFRLPLEDEVKANGRDPDLVHRVSLYVPLGFFELEHRHALADVHDGAAALFPRAPIEVLPQRSFYGYYYHTLRSSLGAKGQRVVETVCYKAERVMTKNRQPLAVVLSQESDDRKADLESKATFYGSVSGPDIIRVAEWILYPAHKEGVPSMRHTLNCQFSINDRIALLSVPYRRLPDEIGRDLGVLRGRMGWAPSFAAPMELSVS